MRSFLKADRKFGWRDIVLIVVWVALFAAFLPQAFNDAGWMDDLRVHLLATFVAAALLATGGAAITAIVILG